MRYACLIALPVMLTLAACQQQPTKQDAPAAAPDAKPGMAVAGGTLVLPAVKGNPAAAYFSVFNGNDREVTLVAVSIAAAGKAEMHQSAKMGMAKIDSLAIKPSWTQRFYRGGRHVMAFDLDPALAPGGQTEITLTFADGDKVSAPLKIEAAGAAAMGAEHGH
jgi:copper(I)-binding protein